MAEYIERTEELMLAMNAGARAIENTKRYHGAVYTKDVFSESPQEIPYLQAAKVLREVSDAPAADVAPVVRCQECKYYKPDEFECGCDFAGGLPYVKADDFCSYGERKDGAEC
jgi:hypothetical protein